jgi:phosphoglycolate phosphatase-like HAD superfamily hydrolase
MRPKAIIFDFDGTLCNSLTAKEEAFGQIYKNHGKKVEEKVKKYHRENLGVSRQKKFLFFQQEIIKDDYSNKRIESLSNKFSSIVFNKVVKASLMPGALNFLKKFDSDFQFFLSSATPQNELKKITKEKKIDKFFKAILGSPDEKYFHILKILKKHKLSNDEVVYIGDSFQDKFAAKKAKVNFIGFNHNNFNPDDITFNHFKDLDSVLVKIYGE